MNIIKECWAISEWKSMFMRNVTVLIFTAFFLMFTSCKPDKVAAVKNTSFTANRNAPTLTPIVPVTGSSITLQSPAISPNNISTPSFLVGGVIANTTVKLYTNSTCTLEVGKANATTTSVVVTISALVVGSYNFYTKSFNSSGASSTCSSALASYIYKNAPANLSYSPNPVVYPIGPTIADNVPFYTGDLASYFSISRALPAGLFFDTTTGVISGTPNAVSPSSTYIITVTNGGGSTFATLILGVAGVGAPNSLAYSPPNPIYTRGVAITNNLPTYLGAVATGFSISPPLPAGLSLNTMTGIISGTPTAESATTAYTVTLTNASGTTTATINLRVASNGAPTALTYIAPTATYTSGTTITNNTATYTGGLATSFTVTPALPSGLILNPSTGIIYGTPSVVSSATNYVVIASNLSGSTTATLSIIVLTSAPTGITYTTNPANYTNGSAIASNTPSVTGGAATSFTITPTLPSGLIFNTTTGVITGTPTVTTARASYSVTATNSTGSFTNTLSLQVAANGTPPSALSYSTSTASYINGTAITNNTPTYSGSAATSFSINQELPTGLTFNTTSGYISGTPTVTSAATTYTVTATNDSGSTTVNISITVLIAAPSSLSYPTNPATYTNGTAITDNTPTFGGGTPDSYSILQALPGGLSFNTTTGTISGTPTAISSATNYTITATNSSGSKSVSISIAVAAAVITPITATSITRQLPTSSPNSIATPSFTLSGLAANTTAKLYTNATCTTEVGSAYATTTSVVLTASALTVGDYNFYTKSINAQGTSSACSGLMLSYSYYYQINATFSYEFIPASTGKLNYAGKSNKYLREVYIEMKKYSDSSIISTGSTDANGNIKFYLPRNDNVYFEISAEIKTPSVIVVDNTSNYARYVAATSIFTVNGNTTINQTIPCGWSGSNATGSYTGARVSAPFAILDSVYAAIKKVKDTGRSVTFPPLQLAWSIYNAPVSGSKTAGNITTSAYWPSESRIYILGKADVDTDEFDRSVVVHEWGHYFEHNLSRANNIGGQHSPGYISDITLAWGEGWPNALSAIVFDPDINYVDTSGVSQQTGWIFSLADSSDPSPGWFSESSIQQIFFRLYDSSNVTAFDNLGLGFGPLLDIMIGPQKTTTSLTSVFSFISALKTANPTYASNIDSLVSHYNISVVADKYGSTETNDGGFAGNLPIYNFITVGGAATVHLYGYADGGTNGAINSAFNNKFITFTATSATTRLEITPTDTFYIDLYENGSYNSYVGGATRTSASAFGPYAVNIATVSGKEYTLRISTDKNGVYYTNAVVDVGIRAIAQ